MSKDEEGQSGCWLLLEMVLSFGLCLLLAYIAIHFIVKFW